MQSVLQHIESPIQHSQSHSRHSTRAHTFLSLLQCRGCPLSLSLSLSLPTDSNLIFCVWGGCITKQQSLLSTFHEHEYPSLWRGVIPATRGETVGGSPHSPYLVEVRTRRYPGNVMIVRLLAGDVAGPHSLLFGPSSTLFIFCIHVYGSGYRVSECREEGTGKTEEGSAYSCYDSLVV